MGSQMEREAVKKIGGSAWRAKVDKMPDNQITAIYIRLKSEGKIK